ncbi:hypothetical protein SCA6_015573 [Theobroma cacao]
MGTKPKPLGPSKLQTTSKDKVSKPQSLKPNDMGKPTGLEEGGGMVLDKRKHLEKEKILCPEEPAKIFQRWQLVNNEGISGTKDRQGKEIGSEDDPKDASIPIFNRFHVISEEDDGAKIRTAKQGRTEVMNSATEGKKISPAGSLSTGRQQEGAAETLLVRKDVQHMEKADPKVHGESTQIVQHAGMSEALVVAPVGGEGSVTPVEERDASSWELTVPVDGKLLHDLEQAGEGAITAEQTANNVRQAQCYVEHGRKVTDRKNKKKKSLQKHIIEGSAQEIAHANVDVEKGGLSVDRVENSSNQVHGVVATRKQKQKKSTEKSRDGLEKPAMHEDVQQLSESGGPQGEKDQTDLMTPIGSVGILEPAVGMSVQADVGAQIKGGFFIPSTRETAFIKGGDHQSERERGEQIMPVDMLEGSGDYSPINEQRASPTRLSEQNWANSITGNSSERVPGYTDEPPNLESASGKCLYNTEMSHIPSVSETQYAELEVHPLVRQRRHSDTSASLGRMEIASEEAVDMGENDGVSEEDSISIIERQAQAGTTAAKGEEIITKKPENVLVTTSNRFDVIREAENGNHKKQGQTELMNSVRAGKNICSTLLPTSAERSGKEGGDDRQKGISAAQTDLQQQQTNKEGGEVEKIICRRSERRIGESSTALQAEGRRAPSTAELVAVKSKSHAERAQKNSVPVSPRSSANERPRSENVSAFARKNTIPGVLLGKDVNQRNDKFTYDETEQEQKIDNTATKESQNQTVALEEEKGKTEAAQFASGSCTPLQLMQGERKASGQASIHAYGDKTNEGKGPDVEHSFDGKEHPTTVRPLKLQNKAKPILTKLIPSLNVDFDMGSAALLFDKTSANDESQLRQATKARDEDNSAEHLKNLSPKIGKCFLNKQTDSVPSFADACSSSEQTAQPPRTGQEQEDRPAKQNPQTQHQQPAAKREQRELIPNDANQNDGTRFFAPKQSKIWHAVGTSGTNNPKGKDKVPSGSKQVQTAVSNSFEAIQEENKDEQKNLAKQGRTEMNSGQSNAENPSSIKNIRRTSDTETTPQAEDRQPLPVDDHSAEQSNTRIQCTPKPATVSQQLSADGEMRNVPAVGTNEAKIATSILQRSKDECQRKEIPQLDGTGRGKKIENNASKESQNRSFEFEKHEKTSAARRNMHEASGSSSQELQPTQGERAISVGGKAETAAAKSDSGRCVQLLQLLQKERKSSGQAPSHAGDNKTDAKNDHDVAQSIPEKAQLTSGRQPKLQKKAKPILSKLVPSFSMDIDMGSAAPLFEMTNDNDGSQLRLTKDVTKADNSVKCLTSLPSEPGENRTALSPPLTTGIPPMLRIH